MISIKLDKASYLKILFIFTIFLLFLANATGLFEIGMVNSPAFSINGGILTGFDAGQVSLQQLLSSYQFYCLIIIGLCLSLLLPIMKPAEGSLLTFLCMLPPYFISYFFPQSGSLIPFEYIFIMILIIYVVNILVSYFTEIHSKQALLNVFGQYVPPELANQISKHPDKIDLSGEAKELTVFFSDLQDFTAISEQLNPKQLTLLLNEYFTAMTEVLYQHGATIDKYIGDSIMAFWGAPFEQEDHASRSIAAALQMHKIIEEISVSFRQRGWPAPKMSIGINSGIMNVGNMGSKYRVAYTVIGDAVNLASRVEHLTRYYKVPSIVTESTKSESDDFIFRELDRVQVRGKHNFTRIYEPVCHKDDLNQLIEKELNKHNIALNHFYKNNWHEAEERFKSLYTEYNNEYYKTMFEQISGLQ